HRLAEPGVRSETGARAAVLQTRLGAALADDAGVVRTLVLALDARQHLLRPAHVTARFELVGQRQEERDDRLLILVIDAQHVEADTLGLGGLVQDAVAFGSLERSRDGISRERLELEHGTPPQRRGVNSRSRRASGS